MSDIFKEFGVDLLCPRYAGPTAAEVRMEREIARLRADNDHLKQARSDALAGGDALREEVARLRAERDAFKAAAREFLTTLGAGMKTGKFHMNGSADMCHFVRQAMQKLDVLAFDRGERRPVGLERLHEEAKP